MKRHINPNGTASARSRRYILGGVYTLATFLFCLWAGGLWWLTLPVIVDIYFTRYVNWSWYHNSENKLISSIGGWVADILFALLGVTFINTFFVQNFAIPTSSLEKTLLIGDYLFVEKLSYGPRMPMTPLALPLAHNTAFGAKSYLDEPSLPYRRLKGLGQIERGQMVVFNFPAGDTVALSMPNPDFYTLCYLYGREQVLANKNTFGEIVYRPIDRRDHYVKRCIGMPGDKLQIIDNQVYIDGKAMTNPEQMQLNYYLQTDGRELGADVLDKLEINHRDVSLLRLEPRNPAEYEEIKSMMSIEPIDEEGRLGAVYFITLTLQNKEILSREPYVKNIVPERITSSEQSLTYPVGNNFGWTRDNYGPILIPKAGQTIALTPENLQIYARCIQAYEGHKLEVSPQGVINIDGETKSHYTFAQDYYFMMGDNRHNSADSRSWGFVPEDHIVGRPFFVWLSRNDEKPLLSGGIRWGRMFRSVLNR